MRGSVSSQEAIPWSACPFYHPHKAGIRESVVFRPLEFSRLESSLTQNGYLITPDGAGPPVTEPLHYSRAIPAMAYLAAIGGLLAAVIAMSIVVGLIGRR